LRGYYRKALPSPKTLGDQLKARRKELRLSQLQAAEQIGISPSYLNRLEQGNRGRKITAALQHKLDAWLARPVMPQE
jgi:transcriptional regulator with XRE-family HTH domain